MDDKTERDGFNELKVRVTERLINVQLSHLVLEFMNVHENLLALHNPRLSCKFSTVIV